MTTAARRDLDELAYLVRGSRPPTGVDERAWTAAAACRGSSPDLFFPEVNDAGTARHARAVCASCPVVDDCLMWALDNDERYGIWGGLTQRQLARLRNVPRRSRCRACRHVFWRVQAQVLYCDECRIARGDPRWMPDWWADTGT